VTEQRKKFTVENMSRNMEKQQTEAGISESNDFVALNEIGEPNNTVKPSETIEQNNTMKPSDMAETNNGES
jgi:hypothetical protein